MKLSTAIRKGKEVTDKITGELFDFNEFDECVGSCALGSAYIGAIGTPNHNRYKVKGGTFWKALREEFPILEKTLEEMPEEVLEEAAPRFMTGDEKFIELVYTFNDTKKWSRDKIADWVEKVEERVN